MIVIPFCFLQVVGILNGLYGIIEQDRLSDCDKRGFFPGGDCFSDGILSYEPSDLSNREAIVDELSLRLTSGRLEQDKQVAIVDAVSSESDAMKAYELALQLLLTTPEYHSTSYIDPFAEETEATMPEGTPRSDYKAVIHLMLFGGYVPVPRIVQRFRVDTLLHVFDDSTVQLCAHFLPFCLTSPE